MTSSPPLHLVEFLLVGRYNGVRGVGEDGSGGIFRELVSNFVQPLSNCRDTLGLEKEIFGSHGRKVFITIFVCPSAWKEVSASCHVFSHLMKVEKWKCKSVLVGIYVFCVLREHVESICIWCYFLSCCCCELIVYWVWGLHSPLGGKRSLGVKGLVGLAIEVEKNLLCVERILL